MFDPQRIVFWERELISKKASGSQINLDEIQESNNKEPKVYPSTETEVKRPIDESVTPLPLLNRPDRGNRIPCYIDSILLSKMSHW